jgi:hypothetical protein
MTEQEFKEKHDKAFTMSVDELVTEMEKLGGHWVINLNNDGDWQIRVNDWGNSMAFSLPVAIRCAVQLRYRQEFMIASGIPIRPQ